MFGGGALLIHLESTHGAGGQLVSSIKFAHQFYYGDKKIFIMFSRYYCNGRTDRRAFSYRFRDIVSESRLHFSLLSVQSFSSFIEHSLISNLKQIQFRGSSIENKGPAL